MIKFHLKRGKSQTYLCTKSVKDQASGLRKCSDRRLCSTINIMPSDLYIVHMCIYFS
jgi:hypothetical protein